MRQHSIRIGLLQTEISENQEHNLKKALSLAERAAEKGAKIICLPELFRHPYFPQYEDSRPDSYAEEIPGGSTRAFSKFAAEHCVVVIVPVFEKGDCGRFYNSAAVINSDGEILTPYRKVHIPYDPLFYEKKYFSPGDAYRVYETAFCRIGVLICYDQWFSEPARAVALKGADCIFYPTAIGKMKGISDPLEGDWQSAWKTVQRGHAISNSIHVAAVNRTGTEGELEFWGGSFVCDSFGNIVAEAGEEEEVLTADISLSMNRQVREGWGFMKNRRPDTYDILTRPVGQQFPAEGYICPPKERPDTPKKLGYRMPAEWERHDAVWLSWPQDNETFFDLPAVERSYAEIISILSARERVRLLVCDSETEERVSEILREKGARLSNISIYIREYSDVWFRDYGPIFLVKRDEQQTAAVDWIFNAWGNKYEELLADNNIPSYISRMLNMKTFSPGVVLEGGSVDVNGKGTLLTTRQCLLNENRNPSLSKEEIEEYLDEYLGAENVIWLESGIAGDDTDGHIDDIARFADENTVICAVSTDTCDENHAALQKNYEILKKSKDQDNCPLNVVTVPMPGRIDPEILLPASYTNFLIGNGVVIVPVFGTENDSVALERIGEAFPGRKIFGVDCRAMVYGSGTIHCISQQQPSP